MKDYGTLFELAGSQVHALPRDVKLRALKHSLDALRNNSHQYIRTRHDPVCGYEERHRVEVSKPVNPPQWEVAGYVTRYAAKINPIYSLSQDTQSAIRWKIALQNSISGNDATPPAPVNKVSPRLTENQDLTYLKEYKSVRDLGNRFKALAANGGTIVERRARLFVRDNESRYIGWPIACERVFERGGLMGFRINNRPSCIQVGTPVWVLTELVPDAITGCSLMDNGTVEIVLPGGLVVAHFRRGGDKPTRV